MRANIIMIVLLSIHVPKITTNPPPHTLIQLDPTYVLIIVFSGRVWDAITDPVVGYLCSITRTRFGRLRPW